LYEIKVPKLVSKVAFDPSNHFDFPVLLPHEVSPQRGSSTLPHLGRAFTDIQEMKQATGSLLGRDEN